MACAALASLRRTIEEIILNPDKYSFDLHNRDRLRSINEGITFLQEFDDKFPELSNYLEGRIVDVANEAQVILDNFISMKICSPFGLSKCIRFLGKLRSRDFKLRLQLEKFIGVIDSIAEELMGMEMNGRRIEEELQVGDFLPPMMEMWLNCYAVGDELQLSESPAANSSSQIAVTGKTIDGVVGFGDDSIAMKYRLCGGSSKLQVIPIVGMGGIGKTTLSRTVYDDPLTIQYFDVRAWVTVSQDYSTQRIVSSIMGSVKEYVVMKSGQSNEETVYKGLKGRRYLIVVDDIWSKDVWDDLRDLFPNDNNGSRIMLTTRLSDVAAYAANGSPLHEMSFLGIEQSWKLLRQRVFGNQGCPPQLENIGKKIARRCKGLPLAISVVAGLLSTVERNPSPWLEIANNLRPFVATRDGLIDEILSLSYTHLPHHLRPCFLFMGGFPEDQEIRVSELVRLWVAEDFLRCSEGSSKSLEQEGEECLEDLVNRSLVLVTKRKYNGRIESCSLHDLIKDLCTTKAKLSKFSVRTVNRYVEHKHFLDILKDQNSSMKSVRLSIEVDSESTDVESLPVELFTLFQLRYLAILSMNSFMVPAAISKLQNLQTLIIKTPWKIDLPYKIWTMPRLRHLICYCKFPYPKETDSALENLQTLSLVQHDDVCVRGILKKIPNIKKLGVDCSYYDYGTHLNNLEHLHRLETLELRNGDWRKDSISFPRLLRKVTLCNMSLVWSEMSIVGRLPNLEVLKLRDFACIGSTWETSEEEFCQLQYLLIKTSKLQHWICEEYHFPRLKYLLLHDCWYLEEIPDVIGEIPTLQLIDVKGSSCRLSLVESAKRIQEEQLSLGNEVLQVHCPPSYS